MIGSVLPITNHFSYKAWARKKVTQHQELKEGRIKKQLIKELVKFFVCFVIGFKKKKLSHCKIQRSKAQKHKKYSATAAQR